MYEEDFSFFMDFIFKY